MATAKNESILAKWLTQKDKAWNVRKRFQKSSMEEWIATIKTIVCTKYNYQKI